MWAVGLGLYSTLDGSAGLGKQVGYAILTGFGVGQTLQPSLVAIQAAVERRDMAVVTGTRKLVSHADLSVVTQDLLTRFLSFVRNLGATLGLAVSGTIMYATCTPLPDPSPQ